VVQGLGLSTSKITAWKNGSIPKAELLQKLAETLHVNVAAFFAEEDDLRGYEEVIDTMLEAGYTVEQSGFMDECWVRDHDADPDDEESRLAIDFYKLLDIVKDASIAVERGMPRRLRDELDKRLFPHIYGGLTNPTLNALVAEKHARSAAKNRNAAMGGVLEGLTPDEADRVAEFAEFIKSRRGKAEKA
jgi:transcriptional regulator with XRE-family HTH domain